VQKLSETNFKTQQKKALEYLKSKDAGFQKLTKKLNLDES